MRFGQDYHRYQVPEWATFYVPYLSLKRLFNKAVRIAGPTKQQPNFTELYEGLECSIDSFNCFHHENYQFLTKREADIRKKYGLVLEVNTPETENANCRELENLLKAMTELGKDLEKLQWYYRVNGEAIQRIYAKLEKFHNLIGPPHQNHKSKWIKLKSDCDTLYLKHTESLNALIAGIVRTRTGAKLHSTSISMCLESTCGQSPLSHSFRKALYSAIRDDQPSKLANLLDEMYLNNRMSKSTFREIVFGLAELSVTCHSRQSTGFLFSEAFPKYAIALDHKVLNHIIVLSCRDGALEEHNKPRDCSWCFASKHGETGNSLFLYIVEHLDYGRRDILSAKDAFGRISLHYSAIYGSPVICQSILNIAQYWGQDYPARLILSSDSQRFTPLHYAVINNHATATKILLTSVGFMNQIGDKNLGKNAMDTLEDLLFIAIKYQYDEIVYLLAKCHFEFHRRSSNGETALYAAARCGREEYVEILLKNGRTTDINIPETIHGWTPLFIACVEGHQSVAKLLIQAGANQDIRDHFGWAANEHAVLRGHLAMAELLNSWNIEKLSGGPASMPLKLLPDTKSHFRPDQCYAVVNFGVLQNGKHVEAVEWRGPSSTSGLSIEVSLSEASNASQLVELPILTDMVNQPFVFPVTDPNQAWLTFKMLRTNPFQKREYNLLGSGAALLKSLNHGLGEYRESLDRARTIPILEKNTLRVIGTVTFTLVIVKPMARPLPPLKNPCISRGLQLVGHRGLGQNTGSRSYLQLGENTIESFLSAAKQGATFVEPDVQLTRDLVPVIYHDLSLSESGTDIPIHDLSFEQFMFASKLQSPRGDPVSVLERANTRSLGAGTGRTKLRSRSSTRGHDGRTLEFYDRMKYTVDFMDKGFKPNTRGDFIQDSFATFEELLEKLPDTIGFNIEIKYPRLHEAIGAGVAPVAIEINTFIDKILDKLFSHVGCKRPIILSSFTPEVCILLAIKQQTYPIMFITNAGKPPMTDKEKRASSLQTAIRFAKRWNLTGIVFASEAL
ncbi:uncharacterized protein ATNIH1004_007755 [Aspergillus tanneri]|uniref:Glycerophosphocholine phosphodiesterase n=1 Tax=Aspergillus tanneri TaxID=1220188 RepID=A0A5M9MH74_9EURO|nr:uncharacterized protein ATNIH1004_007755 [Aspergillus tanneri]KAA8646328.1 hypothetical protein ATNIH1004_007755 [Aspergillus tanneri]